MSLSMQAISLLLLIPLAVVVIYFDVRYRRIPNAVVLSTLIAGLAINAAYGGWAGLGSSAAGCVLAFIPFLLLHIFGAMGAGDVKLFAAIGSVLGANLILPTLVLVALVGGMLAIISTLRAGTLFTTMHGVLRIFVGLLPGWEMPRFSMPADRQHTIPYGVAITLGSLISTIVFRA